MHSLRSMVVAAFLAFAVAACGDATDSPLAPFGGRHASVEADQFPDSNGIFIPDVHPSSCFADLMSGWTDADKDWLHDPCEYAIASAFAPAMAFHPFDQCLEREPVWAAKYFPGLPVPVVRILYMPAYYEDCGFPDHQGDSEAIMVEVTHNATTGHWQTRQMWTSAHFGTGSFDHSRWTAREFLTYPAKSFGFPKVWVAKDKHANYFFHTYCGSDACWDPGEPWERLAVSPSRNAGSRHLDLLGCIASQGPRSGTGRCEGFYLNQRFQGWFPNGYPMFDDSSPYRKVLMNAQFERRDENGPWWGPGPMPPGWTVGDWTNISGPTNVRPGAVCQYFVSSSLSASSIEWLIDGDVVGTEGSIWLTIPQEPFILNAIVSDGVNNKPDAKQINVSASAPACGEEV